ncbi:HNH endonuclease [Phyllobacterium chamaecytisi]|uniref:HNH endonuclease n=1 Tax=Phyllobacterium chamaecytisi TaxID=2876082 RepID=UPI001CCD6EC4|nr:HNH endonuclease [Phyllobacterium sp. KW56]MBZ9604262.1 HNH endonuclease [Phyllobacterium sp. KW56]
MNRKQFIQSHGASCKNWTWSWSFVNHDDRFVIFGVWEGEDTSKFRLVLHNDWEISAKGIKQPGYSQAVEHIRLVEDEGYALRTFSMRGVKRFPEQGDLSPSAIEDFTPELENVRLVALPRAWYVAAEVGMYDTIPEVLEGVEEQEVFPEGAKTTVLVNAYERNREARNRCLKHYGCRCRVCDMHFGERYGELGANYIHVHHIVSISKIGKEYKVDPINDLIPVCPNCHAMLHRTSDTLSVDALREILAVQQSNSHK